MPLHYVGYLLNLLALYRLNGASARREIYRINWAVGSRLSRSRKVIENDTVRSVTCDILLVTQSRVTVHLSHTVSEINGDNNCRKRNFSYTFNKMYWEITVRIFFTPFELKN